MTAKTKSLQGSLFEEPVDISNASQTSPKGSNSLDVDISDEQLTKDALHRPRERLKEIDKNAPYSLSDDNEVSCKLEKSLPKWSHHSLVDPEQLTPVLQHYVELKAANPERILLYRLGDFFECFFEDAIHLARRLELTLTGKEGGKNIGRVPMAGIPHHAADRYCSELIRQGQSVALCDQLELTAIKGSLIKRGITRVLTPGTVIEEGMLQARRNNWLAAVVIETKATNQLVSWGLACADVSTGEFLFA